jgi:hypothetical protein
LGLSGELVSILWGRSARIWLCDLSVCDSRDMCKAIGVSCCRVNRKYTSNVSASGGSNYFLCLEGTRRVNCALEPVFMWCALRPEGRVLRQIAE